MTVTERASARLRELLDDGECVRLYLSAGGCSPSVSLEIVRFPEENDTRHEEHGFVFFVESKLTGAPELTIDHSDKMGFLVSGMPKSSCCGDGRLS